MSDQKSLPADGTEDVRAVPVGFDSDGAELVGEIYLPAGHDAERDGPLPAAVVTGTWTSVRQQMTQRYAKRLAAWGIAALSFDYRTYGESAGEPRQIESPTMKVRRFHAALAGPKTLVWAEGEHTRFYDQEPQVSLSANVAAAFFRTVM